VEGFVSAQDYRVNAEVRRILVSRWVDVARLQLGTTNGVVYLMGTLDTTVMDPTRRKAASQQGDRPTVKQPQWSTSERILHLASSLEKEIRRLRDVRDVIFKLDNVFKRGGRWRIVESQL
jgi:hypothetical protein